MLKHFMTYVTILFSALNLNASSGELYEPISENREPYFYFKEVFPENDNSFHRTKAKAPILLKINHDVVVDPVAFFLQGQENNPEVLSYISSPSFQAALKMKSDLIESYRARGISPNYGFDIQLFETKEKIGYVTVSHRQKAIYIPWVFIDEPHRGKGYVKHVLQTLEGVYKSRRKALPETCQSIFFDTSLNNPMAISATRLGYNQSYNNGKTFSPFPVGKEVTSKHVIFIKNF